MSKKDDLLTKPVSEEPGNFPETIEYQPSGCTITVEETAPPLFDERKLAQRLRAACGKAQRYGETGSAILQGEAVSFQDELIKELTPQAVEAVELWDIEPCDLIEESNYKTLLGFHWQSIGPCVWSASFGHRRIADQVFFTVTNEEGEFVVAALANGEFADAARFFVEDYLRTNGEEYGLRLFGTLPTDTENYAPDILSINLLAQCYLGFMSWNVANFDEYAWASLEETLISEAATPNPQTRVLDILKRYLSDGYAEAIDEYHRERSDEIDDRAKAYLLSRYFNQSYTELKR